MQKKKKQWKVEKKSNFGKKKKKKTKKKRKLKKKMKNTKKKKEECTVDYCCNPQCFGCGGTVIPPHHLDVCIMCFFYSFLNHLNFFYVF